MSPVAPHTPIQYIIGRTEFCGIDLAVDERVLIPRPETELLVETVIDIVRHTANGDRHLRILDLCTGSGNIAISLMVRFGSPCMVRLTKSVTNCRIVASDISEDALAVARRNAEINGVEGRIEFIKSDLFADLNGPFDIIVSNPPYIARPEFQGLQKEVLQEPRIALDGGEDGLDFYRRILSGSALHLGRNGFLAMEIGYGQLKGISDIINDDGRFELTESKKDWRGIDRVVLVKWTN